MEQQETNNIGIMQGRVIPDTLERLQVFPTQWAEEFDAIKKLGFSSVELLDDKENKLRKLLKEQKESFFASLAQSGLQSVSLCADQLCDYSLIRDSETFKKRVEELLHMLEGKGVYTIVIPFFDKNKIDTKEELKEALKELVGFDEKLSERGFSFALEIDLPAAMIKEMFDEFSFSAIGVCYDIGNRIGSNAQVAEEIMMLKNLIVHVHVKDKADGKNVRLGSNSEQLSAAFHALKDIHYTGILTLETCITPNPLKEAQINRDATKSYFKQYL